MENPSVAAQVVVAVIPIVGIVMGSVVVFFWLLWRHRQVMLQIRNNCFKPMEFKLHVFCLLAGLLLTCIGVVLTILFLLIDGLKLTLLGGLIPLSLGVGLLLFHSLSRKLPPNDVK